MLVALSLIAKRLDCQCMFKLTAGSWRDVIQLCLQKALSEYQKLTAIMTMMTHDAHCDGLLTPSTRTQAVSIYVTVVVRPAMG